MPISDWLDLMCSTVTYEAVASRDDYGKPITYSAPVSYRAFVSNKRSRVVSRVSGTDVMSNGHVILNGIISSISPDDRLTLPDGSTPVLLNWGTANDENGPHHTRIYFG